MISENGAYVFKAGVSDETITELETTTVNLVKHLQLTLAHIQRFIEQGLSIMEQIVHRTSLSLIREYATAFSIGKDYHSRCHVDLDMYYTLATVVAPEKHDVDYIIYFFVFPPYDIKVPLRSCDTLLFNLSILHSYSNPKIEGGHIVLTYVSTKTVL